MKNASSYNDIIVAHECGHWFALAASGLAGEFISATVVPHGGVYGLTLRSGQSLSKLSIDLASCAGKMGDPANREKGMSDFRDCIKCSPKVCLPHVCFFLGGGSIDRLLGRESVSRNEIDTNCVKTMVIPAMVIPQISDAELKEVQSKVDEFLWAAFERDEPLFAEMYELLSAKKTVTNADVPTELSNKMMNCAENSKYDYGQLLSSFKSWHSSKCTY